MTYLALRIARSALRRPAVHHYGSHQQHTADLHVPRRPGPHPVAVVLHGGYWQRPYGKLIMRPLCEDLMRRGWAAWNVEYRRIGKEGGGWPETFDDVARAIDHLVTLEDDRLDLEHVSAVGHSAGGQLALWAGGRSGYPPGSPGAAPRVALQGVLALAAVCDLTLAKNVATLLLRGDPQTVPDRWALADPMAQIPLAIPVCLVHSTGDETVPVVHSRQYAAAAQAAGAEVTLMEPPGGHRDMIDPGTEAWRAAAAWLER
jgi:acetyl esterase/lipase